MLLKQDEIIEYLDYAISSWRIRRDENADVAAEYYIDAFQSVRKTLFGEILGEEIE